MLIIKLDYKNLFVLNILFLFLLYLFAALKFEQSTEYIIFFFLFHISEIWLIYVL